MVQLGVDLVGPARGVALHQRHQRASVQTLGNRDAGDFAQGREQVHQRDVVAHGPRAPAEAPPRGDAERHPRRGLEELLLFPQPLLAEHLAVVAQEHDHEVVEHVQLFELGDYPAVLPVHPLDHAVVGGGGALRLAPGHVLAHAHLEEVGAVEPPRQLLHVGLDAPQVVAEQVFRALVGIVRAAQAHGEQQRALAGAVVGLAHEVLVQVQQRAVDRVEVVLHVVALAGAGVGDFLGRRPLAGAGQVRPGGAQVRFAGARPAQAHRNVASDALPPAMHLVVAEKVHLAGAGGVVAVVGEVRGDGEHVARQRRVEAGAAVVARVEPGKKTLPRRHAHRRRRVRGAEVGALPDDPIQGRHADVRVALDGHHVGPVLIVDQQQNVRFLVAHAQAPYR